MIERLIPLADVITPNVDEAEALTGIRVLDLDDMKAAAANLHAMGASAMVITGGHLDKAIDLLSYQTKRGDGTTGRTKNRAGGVQSRASAFQLHPRHGMRIRHSHGLSLGARPRLSRSRPAGQDLRHSRDRQRTSPG